MTRSYRWMANVLDELYAAYDRETAVNMLRNADSRDEVLPHLRIRNVDVPAAVVDGGEWDNLLVALIALRAKFPIAEAQEKVALNIAMREGRR